MAVQTLMAFGGLEEYVILLADALQARGHRVAVFSSVWVPPGNRYRRFLKAKNIPFVWPFSRLLDPMGYVRAWMLIAGKPPKLPQNGRPAPIIRRTLDRFSLEYWQRYWKPDLLHIHGYATGPHCSLFDLELGTGKRAADRL